MADLSQQVVAGLVAEAVVHAFEVVEVGHDHAQRGVGGEARFEGLVEHLPGREPSELIAGGAVEQLVGHAHLVGDVAGADVHAAVGAGRGQPAGERADPVRCLDDGVEVAHLAGRTDRGDRSRECLALAVDHLEQVSAGRFVGRDAEAVEERRIGAQDPIVGVDHRELTCRQFEEPVADLQLALAADALGDVPLDGVEAAGLGVERRVALEVDDVAVGVERGDLEVDHRLAGGRPSNDVEQDLLRLGRSELEQVSADELVLGAAVDQRTRGVDGLDEAPVVGDHEDVGRRLDEFLVELDVGVFRHELGRTTEPVIRRVAVGAERRGDLVPDEAVVRVADPDLDARLPERQELVAATACDTEVLGMDPVAGRSADEITGRPAGGLLDVQIGVVELTRQHVRCDEELAPARQRGELVHTGLSAWPTGG